MGGFEGEFEGGFDGNFDGGFHNKGGCCGKKFKKFKHHNKCKRDFGHWCNRSGDCHGPVEGIRKCVTVCEHKYKQPVTYVKEWGHKTIQETGWHTICGNRGFDGRGFDGNRGYDGKGELTAYGEGGY